MGTWNLKTHLTKCYQSCQPNFNVMQYHRCEAASGVVENDVQTVQTPQDDILSAERTICDIKNEGVSLLASLRSNNSLLSKAIPDNVNSLNQVSEDQWRIQGDAGEAAASPFA